MTRIEKLFLKYAVSAIIWVVTCTIIVLFENNLLNIFSIKINSGAYGVFLFLEIVVIVSCFLAILRVFVFLLALIVKHIDFPRKISAWIEKEPLSFVVMMYSVFWILYCMIAPSPIGVAVTKKIVSKTFSQTIAYFIMTFSAATAFWGFNFEDCYRMMKEKNNSSIGAVDVAKMIRSIIVAIVAWITIVVNFILQYKANSDIYKQLIIFSCTVNNLVILYYPIIDTYICIQEK